MYDAIVIGARCAGSPTAMLLARRGFKVLLVDQATFPSDTISTHILWPHGAEILGRFGLLQRLAATGVPPICRRMTFDVGPFALRGTIPDANDGMTVKTALGRKLRDYCIDPPRGIPLGRVRRKDFAPAGIERVPRMTGVKNGYPILENGRVLEVSNVIWCTGYAPKYDWIDFSLPQHNGVPIHDRGIVDSCPGLYFIGLLFLYSLSSALVGGVGRDAEHIVDHIVSTRLSKREDAVARATTAGRQYA